MKLKIFFISILLFSCHSNKNNDKKEKLTLIVKEWQNKTIQIPSGPIEYKIAGRDTVCSDVWDKPYKILTYIDSIGCTGCKLGFPE
jgi:uncharacterized protein (DUF169 family)